MIFEESRFIGTIYPVSPLPSPPPFLPSEKSGRENLVLLRKKAYHEGEELWGSMLFDRKN